MLQAFKTQTAKKKYIQDIINRIGVCSSLKTEYPSYFELFLELFENHPGYPQKIANMTDVGIRLNQKYSHLGQLELYLIKKNNLDTEDISYIKCITGKDNNKLLIAMRFAIDTQIIEFRNNNHTICEFCKKEAYDVDHINYFEKISTEFLKKYKKEEIPTIFIDTNDGSNRKCFTENDEKFCKDWQAYHKENAKLRILCKTCNNKRPKWDKT